MLRPTFSLSWMFLFVHIYFYKCFSSTVLNAAPSHLEGQPISGASCSASYQCSAGSLFITVIFISSDLKWLSTWATVWRCFLSLFLSLSFSLTIRCLQLGELKGKILSTTEAVDPNLNP